ncbi:MAG TPA: hypothetical protein VN699_04770 [Pirellulales bacterium]|nr:hypothetical protein [Pirellulales bacterium]
MKPRASVWRSIIGVCLLAAAAVVCAALAANLANGAEDDKRQQRERLLAEMRSRAKQTQVRFEQGDRQPQFFDSPVFRYDDQPRHFRDATMWVWTEGGRPVAFQKIEAMEEDPPRWGYCFSSVFDGLLAVRWGDGREYRSTARGAEFHLIPGESAAAARNTARKLQARKLVRNFSARILTDDLANTTEEMRLLPTPIYEYSVPETKSFLGAVFGFATSGTNPDVLILLEPRDAAGGESVWHYAACRMTAGGVKLKYRDETVWEVEYCRPVPTAFPTWTFFNALRTSISGAEAGAERAGNGRLSNARKAD